MYEKLKALYNKGKINEVGLQFWVDKGVITEEQMREIMYGNN